MLTTTIASESSHVLITVFGVMNTVIAGLVAYLKSRGQPMRARMYRDDMDRVVDEIENSEVMWLGISKGVLGYEEINTDGEVTVRSEVARLTRLYDRAVKTNTMNNPDIYMAGGALDGSQAGLRARPLPAQPTVPPQAVPVAPSAADASAAAAAAAAAAVPVAPAAPPADPDESPATKAKPTPPLPPPPPKKETVVEASKDGRKPASSENVPSTGDSKTDRAAASRDGPPEKPDESAKDASKDSTHAGPSAKTTNKPAAGSDDLLDDPSDPTNHDDSKKTSPNDTSG
jgi:hypothetical protein